MSRASLLGLTVLAAFSGARAEQGFGQDALTSNGLSASVLQEVPTVTGVPMVPPIAAGTQATVPPPAMVTAAPAIPLATAAPAAPVAPPAAATAAPEAAATPAPAPGTTAAPAAGTAEAAEKVEGPPKELHIYESVAEFLAMMLFVIIGCGSAMGIAKEPGSAWVLHVALAFGLAITALAYSFGRYSGGQINCAVTLSLWAAGKLLWSQALCNFVGQMLGSVCGALVLLGIFPRKEDRTGALGSNAVSENFSQVQALIAEIFMTFLLCIVVLESGLVDKYSKGIAVIVIGFAVFIAHLVLIPIDGCSINPTRSFGPALVAAMCIKGSHIESDEENEVSDDGTAKKPVNTFKDMWVFWVGPIVGSLCAAGVSMLFQL